jgi:hypothetical protein
MKLKAQFTVHTDAEKVRDDVKQFGNINILVVASKWAKSLADQATQKFSWHWPCDNTTEDKRGLIRYRNHFITVEVALVGNCGVSISSDCWNAEAALWLMRELLTCGDEHYLYSCRYGNPSIQQLVARGVLTVDTEHTSEGVAELLA